LTQFPDLWIAANNLAYLKSEYPRSSNDLEEALELAKRAYQLRPDQANTADTLGWIYYKMGDPKRSLPLLEEAVNQVPQAAIFNYHLGMVLYSTGDKEKARGNLKKATESGEDFIGREEAVKTLRRLS
jgi:tetratricopeptide (TPR) repeat protein